MVIARPCQLVSRPAVRTHPPQASLTCSPATCRAMSSSTGNSLSAASATPLAYAPATAAPPAPRPPAADATNGLGPGCPCVPPDTSGWLTPDACRSAADGNAAPRLISATE